MNEQEKDLDRQRYSIEKSRSNDNLLDSNDDVILLSIIVPVYNCEKYVEECIVSLLNQDIPKTKYEIICIDDGSDDLSGIILDDYAENYSKIIQVVHTENKGVSSARNTGIELSRGEYIWFVDSDDFIAHNVLSIITNFLNDNNPDILYVKPLRVSSNDSYEKIKMQNRGEDETTEYYRDWLWTRIYKIDLIKESGVRFNTKVGYAEDNMFCKMLEKHIKSEYKINELAYFYRNNPNSFSNMPIKYRITVLIDSAEEYMNCKKNGKLDEQTAMQSVYEIMNYVMVYATRLVFSESIALLSSVVKKGLFPLRKQKEIVSYDYKTKNNERIDMLKKPAYTLSGFFRLKSYYIVRKIKLKVKRNS